MQTHLEANNKTSGSGQAALLRRTMLFKGLTDDEIFTALEALEAREKSYQKGNLLLRAGTLTERMALVLEGSVTIENIDIWGNRSILSHVGPGQFFAETYALLESEPLLVDVHANEDCRILFLRIGSLRHLKMQMQSELRPAFSSQTGSSAISDTGSAAGSDTGSDTGSAVGSAAGSDTGSDTGSAVGSAAGSAVGSSTESDAKPTAGSFPGSFWMPKLLLNLLAITAHKNLVLSERSFHTSSKTIRGRLMSYLTSVSLRAGSREFDIPFDRQQLADYLNLERSALSKELGRMQREGILTTRKNHFVLLVEE